MTVAIEMIAYCQNGCHVTVCNFVIHSRFLALLSVVNFDHSLCVNC